MNVIFFLSCLGERRNGKAEKRRSSLCLKYENWSMKFKRMVKVKKKRFKNYGNPLNIGFLTFVLSLRSE